jgi:hypothetical protein
MNAPAVPAAFREALVSLQRAQTRRDVRLVETPAPSRIAPYAVAINGTVLPEHLETTGRFVVLHDPAGQDAWDGTFRVIALVQAPADAEVGRDDMWADAAWSWLDEALAGVEYGQIGGTVTKVVSRSFGQLADKEDTVSVEMRVSWTPANANLEPHVVAWAELLAMCAGVPPAPEGITVLPGGHA